MVSLEEPLHDWLKKAAKKHGVSVSGMIRDIVRDTYNEDEDKHWAKEGESRLKNHSKRKTISHDDAWKE